MDLDTIAWIASPGRREDIPVLEPGHAWLAGGTWLFSEPQPHLTGLVDLQGLGWPPLLIHEDGLTIAATCTIAALEAFEPPASWLAGPLIGRCCHAFLASFKIWNMGTVGGNLCTALPAGPMISLCAALDGSCLVWAPGGSERRLGVLDFVLGPQRTALRAGELLRSIELPRSALERRFAFRQISLTPLGRSGALLIGTLATDGSFALTVTASTPRPVRLAFAGVPAAEALAAGLAEAIPPDHFHDDVHGRPDWRAHVTRELAEEIRAELAGGGA